MLERMLREMRIVTKRKGFMNEPRDSGKGKCTLFSEREGEAGFRSTS